MITFNMSLIKTLSHITGQKVILPFYHAVANNVPLHLKPLYKVRTVKQFENDLDYLLKHYQPIDIQQLFDHVSGIKKIQKPSFFISFDDGLREFKEYAHPVLKKKGIPSALYVNTDFVDNKNLFFRFKASLLLHFISENKNEKLLNEANKVFYSMISSVASLSDFIKGVKYNNASFLDDLAVFFQLNFNEYLHENKPYLSIEELKVLVNDGVHIGAHSMNHPLFMDLNDDAKYSQLIESVKWVNNQFNQSINSFSFPFTDYGVPGSFFDRIYKSTPNIHLTFGTAGIKKENFKQHVQRIPVEDYSCDMKSILQKQYLYYMAKAFVFKNTIKR